MEGKTIIQSELTIPVVEEYLEQLDLWESEDVNKVRSDKGVLDHDWGLKLRDILVARAKKENPRLVPVIMAEYSTDSSDVSPETNRVAVGNQMSGQDISITGHVSESTLWLVDGKENSIQTMVRLVVSGQEGASLIDVYSKPVHPGITKEHGAGMANIKGTEASRVRNLISYVENNHLEVLGWVPIPEIAEHKAPSYS